MDQEINLCPRGDEEPSIFRGQVLLRLQDAVYERISRIRQRVTQSFVIVSVLFLVFWIATFLYWSFYFSYMPRTAFSFPVYYYFRTGCESPTSFLCSYPVANISLMRKNLHMLTFGQIYQISLHLEMPDSPANQQLGMFMIKSTCFSVDGGSVSSSSHTGSLLVSGSSSRFAMLRYRSDLLKYLEMLLLLPAFLGGVAEQTQMLEVELFSSYMNSPYDPATFVFIEIVSNKVQIYSSQLHIHAVFTGIRYFLFHFPLLSAVVGVFSNFIFLSLLLGLSYVRLLLTSAPDHLRTDGPLLNRESNMNSNHQEDGSDAASGTDEMLGLSQIVPTNLNQENPHLLFSNNTEVTKQTDRRSERNESAAA
ncbi:seipin-like isoform X2 [Antennarius striatus]|uniref:seipin-like isoform X2 n=2 Tax=Antennarius striatus TaxID=241820 RepID=UPI0035B2861B